ncbi:hypothetical protein [Arthrobacter crystallopoietes]|uniref:hypothetical protein n=1 Tax=Crystallibacter crystallopoietes TaxID=37928 RepID=UPI0011141968|nr:hypothetical protein [Arthrobacter crystallopoietes]
MGTTRRRTEQGAVLVDPERFGASASTSGSVAAGRAGADRASRHETPVPCAAVAAAAAQADHGIDEHARQPRR